MDEGTPLLREHTPKGYRKFESSRLRQIQGFQRLMLLKPFLFVGSRVLTAVNPHQKTIPGVAVYQKTTFSETHMELVCKYVPYDPKYIYKISPNCRLGATDSLVLNPK